MALILNIEVNEKGATVKQLAGDYKAEMKKMEQASQKHSGGMLQQAKKLKTGYLAVAGAIGGTVAIFAKAINSTAKHRDEIAKMSKATGVAVETLSGLEFAAERSGSSIEGVDRGLRNLYRKMQDVKDGLAEGKRAFDALGVSATNTDGSLRTGEGVFLDVAQALSEMANETEQAALAQDIFGRSGLDLLPLLKEGKIGIKALTDEAERLGVVFSKEEAAQAEAYVDAITNFGTAVKGLKENLAEDTLPLLTNFINLITGNVTLNRGTVDEMQNQIAEKTAMIADLQNQYNDSMKTGAVMGSSYWQGLIERTEKEIDALRVAIQEQSKLDTAKAASTAKEIEAQKLAEMKAAREKAIADERQRFLLTEIEILDVSGDIQNVWRGSKQDLVNVQSSVAETSFQFGQLSIFGAAFNDQLTMAGSQIYDNVVGGLAEAVVYGESLKDIFDDIIKQLGSMLIKFGINAGLNALFPGSKFIKQLTGMKEGGIIPSYASGGMISSGISKPVPIIAHSGEGVLNRDRGMKAVGGPAGLAQLNAGIPPGGNVEIHNHFSQRIDERFIRTKFMPLLKNQITSNGLRLN